MGHTSRFLRLPVYEEFDTSRKHHFVSGASKWGADRQMGGSGEKHGFIGESHRHVFCRSDEREREGESIEVDGVGG